jgi:hypothetical protein
MARSGNDEVAYGKTAVGQLLYDLAFVDRTDKWLAHKHQVPITEIRNLRKSPILDKLRRQVSRDRRKGLL